MEADNFNQWLLSDLKQLLLQYNITVADIEGTGKNGNVIKKDYVRTASLLTIKDNYQDINEDIWFNIMLHLKYKDLKNTCLTDKMAIKVCNNITFWKKKFELENLEIVLPPKTLKEWIKKYKIASTAAYQANEIINLFKKDPENTIETYIALGFDMLKIIPEYKENIKKARSQFVGDFLVAQGFSIKIENGLQFEFFYQNDNGNTPGKFITTVTYDQLFLILYRYLHYFPSEHIIIYK